MIRMGMENFLREYRISSQTNGSASAALHLSLPVINGVVRLLLKARNDNIVFNFGGSGVVASAALTSNVMLDGNFSVEQGSIIACDIQAQSQSYVSVINETASSGAIAIIQVCTVPYN